MLKQFTDWLAALVKSWFTALWDFAVDAVISIFGLFLTAMGTLLAAIPLPDWLSGGLAAFWSALPPAMLYLLTAAGVPQALAIIGAGFGFRLLRKVFTLFQW